MCVYMYACAGYLKEEIVISDGDSELHCDWWIEDLQLFSSDHTALKEEDLTANIINAAQGILKTQFPNVEGFQDTSSAENLKFRPVARDKRSVQILHTGISTYRFIHVHPVHRYS